MKWLKISIFSLAVFMVYIPSPARGQPFSIRTGIYEFSDITAREFYVLAPTILAGYDVWKKSRLGLEVSAGLSFNSIRYNGRHHNLYMVPVFVTVNYDLPNPDSRVHPVIGGGFGLMGKADANTSLGKTHYSLAYGYHAVGGLHFLTRRNVTLTLDLTYNFIIPPASEDLDISGLMTMIGIRLPLRTKE